MKFLILSTFVFLSSFALADTPFYEFESPFFEGTSDVAYDGQTVRQILINSLKSKMGSLKKVELDADGKLIPQDSISKGNYEKGEEAAYNMLQSYIDFKYEPSDEEVLEDGFYGFTPLYFQRFKTTQGRVLPVKVEQNEDYDASPDALYEDMLILGYVFPDTTANLSKKLAGIDNKEFDADLYGVSNDFYPNFMVIPHNDEEGPFTSETTYGAKPVDYLKYLTALWAEDAGNGVSFTTQVSKGKKFQRVSKIGVFENGWDLTQLTQKFLHGAISFSQASRDYLSTDLGPAKGLNADNENPAKPGLSFTTLAHHWDEAFGYFGASRGFADLTVSDVASGLLIDLDVDSKADVKSEVSFGLSINAAKRDAGSLGIENFKENIFNNFVKGRALINQKPEGYREEVKVIAQEIVSEWERLFAANTIHYINKTLGAYDAFNTEEGMNFLDFAKYWSEMKGFSLAFQFNPNSVMSINDFKKLHDLLRVEPELRFEYETTVKAYKQDLKRARLQLINTYSFNKEMAEQL